MLYDTYKPILLKVSPDLAKEQLDDIISYCLRSGIDGLVAGNTTRSREGLTSISQEKIEEIGKYAFVYVDELTIENKTNTTYNLYLKVVNVEQDELADELIDNIEMQVYLDDALIYDGYARGLDYTDLGVDLQNAILIGEYAKNKESKLVVHTKLSEDYSNINNDSVGKIEWEFYASYEKNTIPILPETVDNISKYIILLAGSALMLVFLIIFVLNRKNKKELN